MPQCAAGRRSFRDGKKGFAGEKYFWGWQKQHWSHFGVLYKILLTSRGRKKNTWKPFWRTITRDINILNPNTWVTERTYGCRREQWSLVCTRECASMSIINALEIMKTFHYIAIATLIKFILKAFKCNYDPHSSQWKQHQMNVAHWKLVDCWWIWICTKSWKRA